ncbi:SDR family NAD(P)-dependent oxidoreductase [Acidiferrimicrobium sp. IK]|nr:SDR family NAD(P)-dependent oxidoreductase [Acidiferrimicrobium sp. IK]MCU4184933.1 SDR family NAD(P)-dependent oxidoreductase [Acidiferrimicrobium sp. IK]
MSDPRRVVVTAAASGIGLAIAEAFAAEGDRVHICDIDEQALNAVTEAHEAITGTVCDVSDRLSVEAFIHTAVDTLAASTCWSTTPGSPGPPPRSRPSTATSGNRYWPST